MARSATLDGLRVALVELDERRTLELTRQLLDAEVSPQSILNTCQQALRVVGERYERQEYYISGLIMAGELFKEVLDLVQPAYSPARATGPRRARSSWGRSPRTSTT